MAGKNNASIDTSHSECSLMQALSAHPAAFVLYNFLQALREYGQVRFAVQPDQAKVGQLQASVSQLQAAAVKNTAQLAEHKTHLETLRVRSPPGMCSPMCPPLLYIMVQQLKRPTRV